MLTGAVFYLTLGTPVGGVESLTVVGEICTPVPPEPRRLDVTIFDAGESRYQGAEAIYELSTGDVGEGSLMFDDHGNGEGYLAINGAMVSHVVITFDRQAASR